MEELDLIDKETNNETKGLPVFLKVMCIITFVGSGLTILGAIPNILMEDMTRESMKIFESLSNSMFDSNIDFDQMMKWQRYMNYSNLFGGLLGLTGALMMWKLKKTGFYLYLASWVIPISVYAMGMKYILTGFLANFGGIGIAVNVLIAGTFIVLYGLNFKHLK